MDISLSVKGVKNLRDALEKYMEPEELDGDNKYFCNKCNTHCRAIKTLKFKELPPLLTFQLKRFDIDLHLVLTLFHHSTFFLSPVLHLFLIGQIDEISFFTRENFELKI